MSENASIPPRSEDDQSNWSRSVRDVHCRQSREIDMPFRRGEGVRVGESGNAQRSQPSFVDVMDGIWTDDAGGGAEVVQCYPVAFNGMALAPRGCARPCEGPSKR